MKLVDISLFLVRVKKHPSIHLWPMDDRTVELNRMY